MGEHAVVANRDVFRSGAFAVGIAQSVVWVVLGVATLNVVPKFERIFRDFGTQLPDLTLAVIGFHHLLSHYWYLALLPALAWPFVNHGVVSLLSPRPEVVIPKRLWYFATWIIILLLVMFAVIALFRPLIVLINAVSATPVVPGNPPR
ncbi:MAG: hypothetical protein ABR915_23855 [Thermoguttaceae bacterium]|jgi:hypothetical protein